jgi:hypothetical protein
MKKLIFLFSFSIFISCAPSLKYYTYDIQKKSKWTEGEMKRIQFYISEDIVLYRDYSNGSAEIESGKIKMVEGRKIEEVVIKRGTPGAFLFSPAKDHLAISFDPNDSGKFLVFGPSDDVNGRYVLLAKEWKRNHGNITYGDQVYQTSSRSAFAFLMADVSRRQKTTVSVNSPSGRRVD